MHSAYYKQSASVSEPERSRLERVLNILEEEYACVRTEIREDFDLFSGFYRAVRRLENSSTPGYPYCTESPTIGSYLGFDGLEYNDFKLQKLWFDVQKLLDGDFSELLFNVFIKEEPHKMEKVDEGRFRLIIGSPLHFQVLCHMLFDDMNDKQIEKSYEIPSQQGIILNGGGWRSYVRLWTGLGLNCGLDKRAWDWTVPGWKIRTSLEFRKRMVYGRKHQRWAMLAEKAYSALFDQPKLILSDGRVFQQLYPGIMKSGCVNTISDNSLMQVIDHILVCEDLGVKHLPLPRAVGDDTLSNSSQVYDTCAYAKYGAVVKSASDGLEFVGMEFTSYGPIPLYLDKHLYKVAYCSPTVLEQYLDAMLRMYSYSTTYYLWEEIALRCGLLGRMRSRQYYLNWYDYDFD